MYVKLFTQILDSSIADNRRLRHFFTDLLLCSDAKGFVIMTSGAIARRIGATVDEVEWGLAELEKPDPSSKTPDYDGRRIERLEGVGYGWRIVNYEAYRALKDADQLRESTKERVRRYRQKKKGCNVTVTHVTLGNANTEAEAEAEALRLVHQSVKKPKQRKKAPEGAEIQFPDNLSNESIVKEWENFLTHRKGLRKPFTLHAQDLMLKRLAEKPERAVEALQEMQLRGWTGFKWEWLDNKGQNGKYNSGANATDRKAAFRGVNTPGAGY
jgi:hypothetical protein